MAAENDNESENRKKTYNEMDFMDEIGENPTLYDMSIPSYGNRDLRAMLFRKLARNHGISEEFARKEYKRMRDRYNRINCRSKQVQSGAPGVDVLDSAEASFLKCFDFLRPHIGKKKRPTSGNFGNTSVDDGSVEGDAMFDEGNDTDEDDIPLLDLAKRNKAKEKEKEKENVVDKDANVQRKPVESVGVPVPKKRRVKADYLPKMAGIGERFDRVISVIEDSSKGSDLEPELEAFCQSMGLMLAKLTAERRHYLFLEINRMIFEELYPRRRTAPRPSTAAVSTTSYDVERATMPPPPNPGPPPPAEPNYMFSNASFSHATPTVHGDQENFGNWYPEEHERVVRFHNL